MACRILSAHAAMLWLILLLLEPAWTQVCAPTSRPEEAFQQNAAAAGLILVLMTLMMNAIAIWLRYRLRKSISW